MLSPKNTAALAQHRRISIAVLLLAFVLGHPVGIPAAEHSPTLDDIMAASPPDEFVPVILFLDGRLEMDEVYPVARSLPMPERRAYVVRTLKTRFAEMSARVMTQLETARKEGQVSLLRPLWILNAVRVSATPAVIRELESNHEILYIASDPVFENTLDSASWSVRELSAPQVWTRFGADGSGVIVGHKDSGVDYTHPGFAGHIWVNPGEDLDGNGVIDSGEQNNLDDDNNGYVDDFYGWNFDHDNNNVADRDGHGTRTAGVISANFTPCDTTCVAPGAKLMILSGYLTQGATWEASQYAVEAGAHVISQSMSFKQSECMSDNVRDCPNYVAHRFVSEMELAAGILHANSTGNDGTANPVPLSIPAPANSPPPAMTPFHEQQGGVSSIISVAGYFRDGSFWTGSGRGPSGWTRENICVHPRMPFCGLPGRGNEFPPRFEDYPYLPPVLPGLFKPDISAPTNVPSVARYGGCSSIGGTSGATPHVAGVCALIYSQFPGITPEEAYLLLMNTALDGGPAGPDTTWGFGKVRPLPACSTGLAQRTLLRGVVSDQTGPLANVRVSAPRTRPSFSNSNGEYELFLAAGVHDVLFESYGCADTIITVTASGGTIVRNVTLLPASEALLRVQVFNYHGVTLSGIPVQLPEIGLEQVTNAQGFANFNIFAGGYDIIAGALPWESDTFHIAVQAPLTSVARYLFWSPCARPTGPDNSGYFILDRFDTDSAFYDWIEINPQAGGLPGETLPFTGGDQTIVRTLPFRFRFYGQTDTQITIGTNGFIAMGSISTNEWSPHPIPNPALPNHFLAPWFFDWEPQRGGRVLYYFHPEEQCVIVEWYNVPNYSGIARATFQAILYDPQYVSAPDGNGVAKFQYLEIGGRFEGLIGIENRNGSDGLEYMFQLHYDPHAAPVVPGCALLITTDSTIAPVVHKSPVLPISFTLKQNYPNPFNPVTTFAWTAPHAAPVRLVLFDVLGRQAATVFDGPCSAGENVRTFDASRMPAGVYVARLEVSGHPVAARKVVLLK